MSPNVLEAEELVGHEFNDDEDRLIAVREMVGLGARGDDDHARRLLRPDAPARRTATRACTGSASRPKTVEPRATVGSGDAFLAGYVAARYSGRSTEDCLAFGVACGAESPSTWAPGSSIPTAFIACSARFKWNVRNSSG